MRGPRKALDSSGVEILEAGARRRRAWGSVLSAGFRSRFGDFFELFRTGFTTSRPLRVTIHLSLATWAAPGHGDDMKLFHVRTVPIHASFPWIDLGALTRAARDGRS
jgi:hypothetical protein